MHRRHIVFDGRVFATEAVDRGMGRYVDHLVELAVAAGHRVTIVRPDAFASRRPREGVTEQMCTLDEDPLLGTTTLNRFLRDAAADVYVDATPFLPPMRYDVHACPVVAILYDLIPLRFPRAYFGPADDYPFDVYANGLARVRKADQVIAISRYVAGHALRYLGIPRDRVVVIEPGVGPEYVAFANARTQPSRDGPAKANAGSIVTIQGAHRSKNFPAAIPFLEQLSAASACDVDVIVPTPTQHTLIEGVRDPHASRVRLFVSLPESQKLAMQQRARVIAHLSLEEGYGIPLAEALYLHRPIICLDTAINRELLGDADPRAAGVLLLDDPLLASTTAMREATQFVREAPDIDFAAARRSVVAELIARQVRAADSFAQALVGARAQFDAWRSALGLGVVAGTEFGTCGVSDYCYALMRSGTPRYGLLLGRASRELQLTPNLKLLPLALLDDIRPDTPGVLFNLAVSDSLTRAFDAIAERSTAQDVLVIHDAGSYMPGLMMQAAATGDEATLFERYLADEPGTVRALARRWLAEPSADPAHSGAVFLDIDRNTRSAWLRRFRGRIVSHHVAFADRDGAFRDVLSLLAPDSEIRKRARYAPMPLDARARPGLARLASRIRWSLGVARQEILVCCAGSVVGGKYLDVVARVIVRLNAERSSCAGAPAMTLLLAGRVLDEALYARLREHFAAHEQADRLVTIVEGDETRYDALLVASDIVVAFRQQRRIQMSHSYVRALALGRPMITNAEAGFDDSRSARVCRDDDLEGDLGRHLAELRGSTAERRALSRSSRLAYETHYTVDAFFEDVEESIRATAAI